MRYMILITVLLIHIMPAIAQATCVQPSRFAVGEEGRVIPGTANNVRSEPDSGALRIGQLAGGETFTVLMGAVCDESYVWIQVQSGELVGWTVEATIESYWIQPLIGDIYADDTINFMYPPDFADEITLDLYPPEEGMGGLLPTRQNYYFRAEDDIQHPSWKRLTVAPVDEITDRMPSGMDALDDLRVILESEAEFNKMIIESIDFTVPIHEIEFPADPFIVAGRRILIVAPHYVDMANGRGVAFVTMHAQDALPVTNEGTIYNFVGITDDESYIVSLQFPIASDMLIDSYDDFEFPDNWQDIYHIYIEQATESLNTVAPDEWRPTLDILDSVVNSIYVIGGFED